MIVECARQLLPVARVTPVPFDAAPRGIGVSISAPSMRSRTVQSLAMALHKLTTNAVKYGTPKQAESHGDTRPCQKVAGPGFTSLEGKRCGDATFGYQAPRQRARKGIVRWPRSFEQNFRVAKWIVGRG